MNDDNVFDDDDFEGSDGDSKNEENGIVTHRNSDHATIPLM